MTTNTSLAEPTTARAWLSTLWIFVLFNMIFADIYSFLNPGFLQGVLFIIWTAWTWREAAHHPRAISSGYAG